MPDERRAALVRELHEVFPGISDEEVQARMRAYDTSLEAAVAQLNAALEPVREQIGRILRIIGLGD